MSWESNAVVKLMLGMILILTVAFFPVPDRPAPNRSLDVGEAVFLENDFSGRPWIITAINLSRDTVVVKQGTSEAIMAAWECVPAE